MEAAIRKRSALIGGGASGIGRAAAEALARAGMNVVITGRHEETLVAAAKEIRQISDSRAEYVVGDLTDPAYAQAALRDAENHGGPIDVLVLNGGGPDPGSVLQIDDAGWREAFELLFLGPLRLARVALPAMAGRGFGRVIVVTSTTVRQPQADIAASVVIRAAVTSAVNLLSKEFAAAGVTVNCVAPGATDTARRRQILRNRSQATGVTYDDLDRADAAAIPAQRAARPAEIAAAIAFLASPESSYVNGMVLTVDGGRTESI
jgi:3-oxoacyl-[acyl-carrier protein] reductase